MSRHAPHRSRAAYATALERLPLLTSTFGEPDDPDLGLPILATREVDGRRIAFALIVGRPAFRLDFTDRLPALLGHVYALDSPDPVFNSPNQDHIDWVRGEGIASTIIDIARFTWHHRHRLLEERLPGR